MQTKYSVPQPLSPKEAMAALRYKSRAAFWAAVHSQGIPHIKITAKQIVFPTPAFERWVESRTIGGGV
jgi:hypothetical protein